MAAEALKNWHRSLPTQQLVTAPTPPPAKLDLLQLQNNQAPLASWFSLCSASAFSKFSFFSISDCARALCLQVFKLCL